MPARADTIISYVQHGRGGGVERALFRLAAGWLAAGRRVVLVIGAAEGPLVAEIPADVERIVLGDARWRAMLALPSRVRAARADLLFCPGNHYTSLAAWTRLRLGSACPPIVAKMSTALDRPDLAWPIRAGRRGWLARHHTFLDAAVAMTPASAAATRNATGLPAERVATIANPPAIGDPGAAPPPLPPGRFVLGVGRLAAQKRWDRLIAALPLLADRAASLVIVGDGPLAPALRAQAAALGVADRLHLTGHLADPAPVMARAAVLALPSEFEGVPGVLHEALAVGTPVVATRSSPAIDEIVATPALGSVVTPGDAAALVAALNRWLAPGAIRPAPVSPPGADAAARYLDLFDRLVALRA